MTSDAKPRSDLGIRTLSGVVMMGIAIAAVWIGGFAFTLFVALACLVILWEFWKLVCGFTTNGGDRVIWLIAGVLYIGVGFATLLKMGQDDVRELAALIVGAVIATDVGAYFAGRTFGGPKIAPKISPSKTWSGLLGGMVATSLYMCVVCLVILQQMIDESPRIQRQGSTVWDLFWPDWPFYMAIAGCTIAIVAQTGDFFESWIKRRAGVKDSGRLIPGHGGLFDRTDGLIAVLFIFGILQVVVQ